MSASSTAPAAFSIAELSPAELESERRALVAKAAGDWESLSTTDLARLSAITSALRRRTAGPPKAAKAAKTASKVKLSADQVLDLI